MTSRVDSVVSVALDVEVLAHAHNATSTFLGRTVTRIEEPLLQQLRDKAGEAGSSIEGGNANGKPVVSRMPAAQEAAFSLVVEIESTVHRITRWLGASGSSRTVADNLDWIAKEIDHFDDDAVHLVAKTLRDFRYRAEVELYKVDPPRALNGRCPECRVVGSVRVYFKHYEIEKAECRSCRATWSPDQLGSLSTRMTRESDPS